MCQVFDRIFARTDMKKDILDMSGKNTLCETARFDTKPHITSADHTLVQGTQTSYNNYRYLNGLAVGFYGIQ